MTKIKENNEEKWKQIETKTRKQRTIKAYKKVSQKQNLVKTGNQSLK